MNHNDKAPAPGTGIATGTDRSLDVQLEEYRRNRFLAMPLTGALVWTVIGAAGAVLPPTGQVWTLFIGTGSIAYLGMFLSRFTGEHFLDRGRPRNTFDSLFFHTLGMALLVYAIALPFFAVDYTSLPLTVGILSGLMWAPMSWMLNHWIGLFHAVCRTLLVLGAWIFLPDHRFVAVPLVIVAVYLVTIAVLERRWRTLGGSPPPSGSA